MTRKTLREDIPLPGYLDRLQNEQEATQDLARKYLQAAQRRQKKLYDLQDLQNQFNVGDLVYVVNQSRAKGKSPKLQNTSDRAIRRNENIGSGSVQPGGQQDVIRCPSRPTEVVPS